VLEDNAGEPFVTTTRTDAAGFTRNRVIAGTRAHTHPDMDGHARMEVRWIDQTTGEAIVDSTITYLVLPGRAADGLFYEAEQSGLGSGGESGVAWELMHGDRPWVGDKYGNPVAWSFTFPDTATFHAEPAPDGLGNRVIVIDARGCSPLYVVAEGDTIAKGLIEDEGTLARYEITFHRTTDCRDL
jgi:hypothetical protein